MPPKIEEALRRFQEIYLNGIPFLLEQNDTAFLSFLCVMCATDALAGYRYQNLTDPERFKKFVADYFPATYSTHAAKLWLFRCRMLHNFSPAHFSLVHGSPESHLQVNPAIGDHFLSDVVLFGDLKTATNKYFSELHSNTQLQRDMLSRLENSDRGGAIFVTMNTSETSK